MLLFNKGRIRTGSALRAGSATAVPPFFLEDFLRLSVVTLTSGTKGWLALPSSSIRTT